MPIFSRSRRKSRSTPLLLFDFDGTLADTVELGVSVFNGIAGEYNLPKVRMEDVPELRKLNTRALLDRVGVSRMLAVKVAARMRSKFKDRISEVSPLPGVAEVLLELREAGVSMAVLSSNSARNIRRFLKQHGLIDCFEFVEGGASLFGKSERLKRILKKEKLQPAQILYVGDETRDMEAARVAGVRAVAACWGVNEEEAMSTEDPEFILAKPSELVQAVGFAKANKPAPGRHCLHPDIFGKLEGKG